MLRDITDRVVLGEAERLEKLKEQEKLVQELTKEKKFNPPQKSRVARIFSKARDWLNSMHSNFLRNHKIESLCHSRQFDSASGHKIKPSNSSAYPPFP